MANSTGWLDGQQQDVSATPNPPCTVSPLFCVPFTKVYEAAYRYNIPCWVGEAAGEKFADHVIDTCTKNSVKFDFLKTHSAQFQQGFWNGYGDTISASRSYDGVPRLVGR